MLLARRAGEPEQPHPRAGLHRARDQEPLGRGAARPLAERVRRGDGAAPRRRPVRAKRDDRGRRAGARMVSAAGRRLPAGASRDRGGRARAARRAAALQKRRVRRARFPVRAAAVPVVARLLLRRHGDRAAHPHAARLQRRDQPHQRAHRAHDGRQHPRRAGLARERGAAGRGLRAGHGHRVPRRGDAAQLAARERGARHAARAAGAAAARFQRDLRRFGDGAGVHGDRWTSCASRTTRASR